MAFGLLLHVLAAQWEDTPVLTDTWRAVSGGDFNTLLALSVSAQPGYAHLRASDGRGPMWWAYEFKNPSALALFKHFGVSDTETDGGGSRPSDTFDGSSEELAQLIADAEQRVPGIPAMLQQFSEKLEEMKRQQADRFEEDSAPFADEEDGADGSLDSDEREDEPYDDAGDDEDEEAPPSPSKPPSAMPDDIAAKVAALKAKAQAIKDEV